MILIINLNKYPLHYYEFVKPITDLITKKHKVINYKNLRNKDLKQANKIILTGTSLKNYEYLKHPKKFNWIKNINKPILGICAGTQIIGKIYNSKLIKNIEIGPTIIKKTNNHPFFNNIKQAYNLHNLSITQPKEFKTYLKSKNTIQAIKHKTKEIYAVLFHPEVLNKELIVNFTK